MRFRTFAFVIMLLLAPAVRAQESEFPTLDALANLDIPAHDYVDAARRLSRIDIDHTPPSKPPVYQIGGRQSFMLPANDNFIEEAVPTELRGMTENVLIWVEESADYSRWRAQTMAERVEEDILTPLQQLFKYSEPPGVDGDPRFTIVMMHNTEFSRAGIFPVTHTLPRALYKESNQREMMVINLALDDGSYLLDDFIAEIIAHEYQHILLHHRDRNEEVWLNEALSEFVAQYTAGPERIQWTSPNFLEAPNTGLTHLLSGPSLRAKYAAGALFIIYLAERFGDEIVARVQAESADGWRSVEKVLRESAGASADEVFADWVLANYFQDADRGFGYQSLDKLLVPPQPVATLHDFPALHNGRLPQYSSDYLAVDVRGADKLWLRLTQAPEAYLIKASPFEGDHFYYAATRERSNSRLTREIDLHTVRRTMLEFRIWYDLEENLEYGYLQVSTDGGEKWTILPGEHTVDETLYGQFYPDGYTGSSGGWLQERISLSRYAGRKILLRFETLSDLATTYNGMAIDDLRIDAINYHDGFESPDDAWIEEGWIRTDNRLPQRAWLQVVQENAEGLHLTRSLMTSSGDMTVELLPDVSQALVAISPIVPQTSLETQYSLEVNLIDADGALMAAARICTVTTTHALNFRDAPNGDKIGLLPQGTAATALSLSEGWFKVAHDGKVGWISGDYVTLHGDCA